MIRPARRTRAWTTALSWCGRDVPKMLSGCWKRPSGPNQVPPARTPSSERPCSTRGKRKPRLKASGALWLSIPQRGPHVLYWAERTCNLDARRKPNRNWRWDDRAGAKSKTHRLPPGFADRHETVLTIQQESDAQEKLRNYHCDISSLGGIRMLQSI